MNPDAVIELVEFYLPVLVTAGDFARRIQPAVAGDVPGPQQKNGINAWTRALTDADLMVQHFVEIATLSQWPEIGFFGEESEQSANTKYFPVSAKTIVHLDPINGTYLYKNRRSGWDIILSIRQEKQLVAAISYMPVRGRFYLAIRGIGALTGDRQSRCIADLNPLTTQTGSRRCLTYRTPDVVQQLSGAFECFDIVDDDDPLRGIDNLNDLFTGKLDAFACRQCELLDWGASAFIVSQAGGCASYLSGQKFSAFDAFDPQATFDMLVSTNAEVHRQILALLRDRIPDRPEPFN